MTKYYFFCVACCRIGYFTLRRAFKHFGNTHFIPTFGFDQINSTSTNSLDMKKTYSTQISLNSPHFYSAVSRSGRLKTRQRIKKIVQITTNHRINNGLLWLITTTVYLFMHFVNTIYKRLSQPLHLMNCNLNLPVWLHAVNASGLFQIIWVLIKSPIWYEDSILSWWP